MNVKTVSNEVVSGIAKISKKKLELHEPYFFRRDFEIIKKCLKSTNVSSHSKYVNIFEKKICSYTILSIVLPQLMQLLPYIFL